MSALRRSVLVVLFLFISQSFPANATFSLAEATPEQRLLAQPAPSSLTIEVVHVEGAVFAKKAIAFSLTGVTFVNESNSNGDQTNETDMSRRWGYRPGYWWRHFTAPQFCDNPNNAPFCPTGDLTDGDFTNEFEAVREGDILSEGDEIYTDDESGVVLTIGSATGGAGSGKLVLAQHSALNLETLEVSADVTDIHLRLDAGLLATMPGATLPSDATFEIAVPDEAATNSEPPSGSELKIWGPARILPVRLDKFPALMVGHDLESGDIVVSVLDGTASLIDGDNPIEIPPGTYTVKQKIQDKEGIPPNAPTTMTDQEQIAWVSALRFGDSDPEPFPILAPHLDSEPEPFPVYSLVHSTNGHDQGGDTKIWGDPHIDVNHTALVEHTDSHDDHSGGDHATEEAHASTDHHNGGDSHTDSGGDHTTDTGHIDTGSLDSGSQDTGSHDSGSGDHVEPTEQPHS